MTQFKKDMLSALVFFLIGVAVLISIPYTIKDIQVTHVGPRAFPYFVGWCITGLSVVMGLTTLYKQHKLVKTNQQEKATAPTSEQKKAHLYNELRAMASAVLMLAYAIVFDKIGYFLSTFLFITALLALFRIKKPLPYLICYAVGAAIWAAFTFIFSVRLP